MREWYVVATEKVQGFTLLKKEQGTVRAYSSLSVYNILSFLLSFFLFPLSGGDEIIGRYSSRDDCSRMPLSWWYSAVVGIAIAVASVCYAGDADSSPLHTWAIGSPGSSGVIVSRNPWRSSSSSVRHCCPLLEQKEREKGRYRLVSWMDVSRVVCFQI